MTYERQPSRSSRKTVLIVEDEPLIAYDLVSEIESEDHVVVGQCNTAVEAISLCDQLRPDVVVMDIGLLGDRTGLDAARTIRESFDIGSIFVSATLDRVRPDDWDGIRPIDRIRKPYRDQALAKAISSVP
ncbi:MAG: response regulator [Litorimonas sp.]